MRRALSEFDNVKDIETDVKSRSLTFRAPVSFDVDAELDSLAKNVAQFKDWKLEDRSEVEDPDQ